jgi:Glucodextranase, domain B/PASTA domain
VVRGSHHWRALVLIVAACVGALLFAASAGAAPITGSSITTPANDSELFYDGDSGAGSITVRGTATGPGTSGDLLCYSLDDSSSIKLASSVPISSEAFQLSVSLAPVAERVCRLALVPAGTVPTGAAAALFAGPAISVSAQFSYSANGSEWGYDILSGRLEWSFELDSLGQCPLFASWSTDPLSLGSFELFSGDACLPQSSGVAPELQTRSALQIDGLNAYAPGAIGALASDGGGLTGDAGFEPLSYSASFDPAHDTVTISEKDIPMVCDPPGGFPPTASSCPSLHDSGIEVLQTTTLLPGGQVARISQQFSSVDGHPHTVDSLFSQSVGSPTGTGVPGFQFPGQDSFASHATPDTFTLFPPGPSSIIVIGDSTALPGTSNPIGAVTYSRPPTQADFISATGAHQATLVMHYTDSVPAGGSVTYNWSFTQAADSTGLLPLEQLETDRFVSPSVSISRPANHATVNTKSIVVQGAASDLVGISSLTLDGMSISLASGGLFSAPVNLAKGKNTIVVTATNDAGNTKSAAISVTYEPPTCTVPKVAGKLLAAAKKAIESHGCAVGRVTKAGSKKVRKGHVISTKPEAGTHRGAGYRVGIVVSRGR